jgi:hypothetical protein
MTVDGGGYLARPAPSGLADVIELVLDKGIVVDAYVRISLLGIELLTVDARVVVASVDTYLRFAEATNRLDLEAHGGVTLPEMLERGVEKTVKALAADIVEKKIDNTVEAVVAPVKQGAEKVVEGVEKVVDVAEAAMSTAGEAVGKVVEAVKPEDRGHQDGGQGREGHKDSDA